MNLGPAEPGGRLGAAHHASIRPSPLRLAMAKSSGKKRPRRPQADATDRAIIEEALRQEAEEDDEALAQRDRVTIPPPLRPDTIPVFTWVRSDEESADASSRKCRAVARPYCIDPSRVG